MRFVLVLTVLAVLAAGCVRPAATTPVDAAATAPGADAALPEPAVFTWDGHIVASEIEGPTHIQPTEQLMWPVMQEGFLYDFTEVPEILEVAVTWEGAGALMVMLHSHKEEGTNVYREHITELTEGGLACLRVPAEDLGTGHWQIMVHSDGARNLDYTLHVATVGGAGALVDGEYHGHKPEDGGFEVEEREIEACSLPMPEHGH